MAKFRDLSQLDREFNRSTGDRQRHAALVRELMRDNLAQLLEEIDIFRSDNQDMSGNLQKISVKMAKEYRFIFGHRPQNTKGTGQAEGVKRGQVVGSIKDQSDGVSGKDNLGGIEKGRLIFELTPEDIDDILDDSAKDLNLPYLSRSKSNQVLSLSEARWRGLKENGIAPRLDLEASWIEKIKREKMMSKNKSIALNPKFINDDLRYHGLGIKQRLQTNVLLVCIMDKSSSMDAKKRYFTKCFLYAVYNFVREKYLNSDRLFILHDTEAQETDSDKFFRVSGDGGTAISSGPKKALELINKRYDQEQWDIYCVHCTDGENNSNDSIEDVVKVFKDLLAISKLIGFAEIQPDKTDTTAFTDSVVRGVKNERFRKIFITKKEDLRRAFDDFLSIEQEV